MRWTMQKKKEIILQNLFHIHGPGRNLQVFASLGNAALDKEKWPEHCFFYAKEVLRGPFPEGEQFFKDNPSLVYKYATEVLHARFLAGEKSLLSHPILVLRYCQELKISWKEGEDSLRKYSPAYWEEYKKIISF